ncbi:MAG: hypothetical protein Kow0075_16420 [Salibacteraceae bacterium]
MRYSERITDSSRPGKIFLLLVFFFLLLTISAFSQSKEEKKMRLQAVKALNSGKFQEAQKIYIDLLKLDPDNPDYNYEMGLAIFEEGIHRGEAAPYFEKAIINTKSDTLPDMFLFAGKAEQYRGNFDLAIEYFELYKSLMAKKGFNTMDLEEDVDRYIEMCENGKVQFENNKDFIRIENLGPNVNSEYPDYSPVVTNDESIILFTSRRPNTTGGGLDIDNKYFEDIYYSLNIDGNWTPASNYDSSSTIMNSRINTEAHDATITYAANETQLYIYREQDVWVSHLENGIWTVPVKHQGRINSQKGFEPSVFITQDLNTMFVVSDLSTGYGGRDIYITTRDENGTWKPLENLGRVINTKFDEDAPFLTPDGNTLYFASNGHNSMGDYDIFKSVLDENGNWSEPENLGHPINTPGHDRYFVTTDDGAIGYYASDRDGGYGEVDIYRIILDCKAVSATKVSGIVMSKDNNAPVKAKITLFDPKTKVIIKSYENDPSTGKYEMRLKTETTYGFKLEAEGYLPHSGEFTVSQQCDYYTLFQEIEIQNLHDTLGRVYAQRAKMNNAFFNVDQKIEETIDGISIDAIDEQQLDSLRSVIASMYTPVELTNYVQLIDIIDPNGIRLASEVIGNKPVEMMQTRDEIVERYVDKIRVADEFFYREQLPEARANYLIAGDIKPDEEYPKQQVEIIENKLANAPFTAFLSTIPEEDQGQLIVPELIDSSSLIIPEEIAMGTNDMQPSATAPQVNKAEVAEAEPDEPVEEVESPQAVEIAATKTTDETESVETPVENQTTARSKAEKMAGEANAEETIVFRNILFDFDKYDLRPKSIEELNKVTNYMMKKPEVEVRIDGHADWIGTVEYNLKLSERRALAAYNYIAKQGISEARLSYQFFGESVPIAPNANPDGTDNPEGRQLNRRCEFKIDQTGTADNIVLKF